MSLSSEVKTLFGGIELNIYLQLFIPLALTFVILLLIMIVRKYLRADSIVLCTVVLLLAVATGIPGFMAFSESHTAELTPKQIAEMTQQNLTIAEQYIDRKFCRAKFEGNIN